MKTVCGLIVDVKRIPVKRPAFTRFKYICMALVEELRLISSGRLARPVCMGSLAGEAEGYRTYILYSDGASEGILLY